MMKIKDVSELTGLAGSTIRYYDSLGLLDPIDRLSNNYRKFNKRDVDILNFISESRDLGFSLAEVKEILQMKNSGKEPCSYVENKIKEKITLIDEHIKDLEKKRIELNKHLEIGHSVCGCHGNVCHYIEGLGGSKDEDSSGCSCGYEEKNEKSSSCSCGCEEEKEKSSGCSCGCEDENEIDNSYSSKNSSKNKGCSCC